MTNIAVIKIFIMLFNILLRILSNFCRNSNIIVVINVIADIITEFICKFLLLHIPFFINNISPININKNSVDSINNAFLLIFSLFIKSWYAIILK